ncbi:MAG: pyruvate kinase [Promethearchaeota archaeon]
MPTPYLRSLTKTKTMCTIGPASSDEDTLRKMFEAGMDVCRINFSHGSPSWYRDIFKKVRNLSRTELGILIDLTGPKIRIGEVDGVYNLQKGKEFIITTEQDIVGNDTRVSITHRTLHEEVTKGHHIFISDGIVELLVKEVRDRDIICEVVSGGEISSRKGVNCPAVPLSLYFPTEKDLKDLDLVIDLKPDILALSFIRRPEDIVPIRQRLDEAYTSCLLISKIEHPDALQNFDAILEASDGIMIARGDLGIEIPIEQVPAIQKELIKKCNKAGKPVITATQMLESMTYHSRPTRAEASDVVNAILDGTDAVMLSSETAIGHDPIQVVKMIDTINRFNEPIIFDRTIEKYVSPKPSIAEILGQAATIASRKLDIDAIIAITRSGSTARLIAKYRPSKPVIAATSYPTTARQLSLTWGVIPLLIDVVNSTDGVIFAAINQAVEHGLLTLENSVLIIAGSLLGIPAKTNLMQVYQVKDVLAFAPLLHQQHSLDVSLSAD